MNGEFSVPYLKEALVERLQADPALIGPALLICNGNPYPAADAPELVYIADVDDGNSEDVAAMTQADESYLVEVHCSVVTSPRNPPAPFLRRAYDLAAAVRESMRQWTIAPGPLLSGDWGHVEAIRFRGWHDRSTVNHSAGEDPVSRECAVIMRFAVTDRLLF